MAEGSNSGVGARSASGPEKEGLGQDSEPEVRSLGAFVLSLCVLACGSGPEVSARGPEAAGRPAQGAAVGSPIVLITLSGLRPDVVGALVASPAIWTPHIDAFAHEADWVGSTVTASSAPAVALVSLMTGVSPWHHQVLTHAPASPRPGIPLLAEVLSGAGYRTAARIPLDYDLHHYGLLAGFEEVAEIEPIDQATAVFSRLGERAPALFWFHLREAAVIFERRDVELPWLASPSAGRHGLDQIQAWRLLPYADPRLPLPAALRAAAWELFCHEVAWADQQVGEILQALKASGGWDDAWVILTASQGLELGEHDQVLYAQNLGRESIEVPLMIRLPRSLRGSLVVSDSARVSQRRLWATLVESSGGRPQPVHAPSLFRAVTPPISSELYGRNGRNEISLLDGDVQLLWSTRFAPEEPEFYYAQLALRGGKPPLSESAHRILGRLEAAFRETLPLSGLNEGEPPRLRLERWTETGVEPLEDRARAERLAVELRRRWLSHVDRERTPKEESALSAASR